MRVALLAIALAGLLVVGGAPASADVGGTPDASYFVQEDNATEPTGPTIGEDWRQVDRALYVTDWEYDSDREAFEIDFYAQRPRTATITESIKVEERKDGVFSLVQQRIVGNQTVVVSASEGESGAATVSITTDQSVNREQGIYLTTGQTAEDPLSAYGGRQGLFAGVGLTILFALIATWLVLRGESSGVEVAGA